MSRRSPQRLDRAFNRREPKKRILIVAEGVVTEVDYFKGLKDFFRALPVDVVEFEIVGRGRDPRSVVDYTIKRWDQSRREAKKYRDSFFEYDQAWCIVDVDDHKTLDSALATAHRVGVRIAVSNPCFDLWLLYHFQKYISSANPNEVQRKLSAHIRGYDKHIPANFPYERHGAAQRNAMQADPDHREANRRGRNPSSNVWLLVDVVRGEGRERSG